MILNWLRVLFWKLRNGIFKSPTPSSQRQEKRGASDDKRRRFQEGQTFKQCKMKNCKNPGQYFCITCVRLTCGDCVVFHYIQLSIKGHHIMSYKEYLKIKSQQIQTGKKYDIWFCQTCKCLFTKQNTDDHTTHSAVLARHLFPKLIQKYFREFLLFANLVDEYAIELEKVSRDLLQLPSNYDREYNSILYHRHFRTDLRDEWEKMRKSHLENLEKNKSFLESSITELRGILAEFIELAALSPYHLKAKFKAFPSFKPYYDAWLEKVDYPKRICTKNSLKLEQPITYVTPFSTSQIKVLFPWFRNATFGSFLLILTIYTCVLSLVLFLIAQIIHISPTRSYEINEEMNIIEYIIESRIGSLITAILQRPQLSFIVDRPGLVFPLIIFNLIACFTVLCWCWKCFRIRGENILHHCD